MKKVFIVEDEVVIREGIIKKIPWEKEGFEIVGEASDGELAFPMIQKTKPDILITDIKMPFMDGLELSRLVKEILPHTHIIILSGYGEFSYAKEAIGIGVTEYLLKPISAEQLLTVLKSVAIKVEEEERNALVLKQYAIDSAEKKRIERQCFFHDLVSKELSTSELLKKGKHLDIELTASCYTIVLLHIGIGNEKIFSYSTDLVKIADEVEVYMEEKKSIELFFRDLEGYALLYKNASEEEFLEQVEEAVDYIKAKGAERENYDYFVAIGNTVQRLSQVSESFDEASKAFAYRYMGRKNQVLFYNRVDDYSILLEDDIDLEEINLDKIDRRVLETFLKSGVKEEIVHFLNDYINGLGETNMNSVLFRQYITMDMYFTTLSFIDGLGIEGISAEEVLGQVNDLSSIGNLGQTKAYLNQLISNALEIRDNLSKQKYNSIIENAKAYIDANYSNEDISLNSIAAYVNMSPSYFSSVFSQEVGKTFVEYLTMVRMNRAKEMLMCTNKKTSDIGYEVGYKDSHYFSYLFKKTQQCSPKEYKGRANQT